MFGYFFCSLLSISIALSWTSLDFSPTKTPFSSFLCIIPSPFNTYFFLISNFKSNKSRKSTIVKKKKNKKSNKSKKSNNSTKLNKAKKNNTQKNKSTKKSNKTINFNSKYCCCG